MSDTADTAFRANAADFKRNILLLSMSTLRGEPETNSFKTEDKTVTIHDCISQLEPIPRYMLSPGICDDADETHIIILSTEAARADGPHTIKKKSIITSAVSFFKVRLEETLPDQKLIYRDFDLDASLAKCIKEAADYIRSLYQNVPRDSIHFWIDTHGGIRDTAQIMTAIVSLLKVDDIIPEQIYGINTNDKTIVDQSYAFHIFEFVSGMESFIRKGDADQLIEYYSDKPDADVQDAVDAMGEISSGLQMSDPSMYTSGLNHLRSAIDSLPGSNSMLSIFSDYIRRDYGDLLDEEKRTPMLIIKRCMDKKLYQQALTFAESLMPEEIMKRGLLSFDLSRLDERGISIADVKKDNKKSYQTDNSFLFDSFINFGIYFFNRNKSDALADQAAAAGLDEKTYRASEALTILLSHAPKVLSFIMAENEEIYNYKGLTLTNVIARADHFRLKYQDEMINAPVTCSFTGKRRTQLGILLLMHKLIRNFRNMFNHSSASDLRPTADQLKTLLGLYIDYANCLLGE